MVMIDTVVTAIAETQQRVADSLVEAKQQLPVMDVAPGMKILSNVTAVLVRTKDTVVDAVADVLAEPMDSRQRRIPHAVAPAPRGERIFRANATAPISLEFQMPEQHEMGKPVCVQGPHGPLHVPVPAGVKPGESTSVWLGPAESLEVTVPEGAKVGDSVTFPVGNGAETVEATVPEGKEVGDTFKIFPSVMMVQMPPGAKLGDQVAFVTPMGQELQTLVPPGIAPGIYFPVACPGLPIVQAPIAQAPAAKWAPQAGAIEAEPKIATEAVAGEEKVEEKPEQQPEEEKTEEKCNEEPEEQKTEEKAEEDKPEEKAEEEKAGGEHD